MQHACTHGLFPAECAFTPILPGYSFQPGVRYTGNLLSAEGNCLGYPEGWTVHVSGSQLLPCNDSAEFPATTSLSKMLFHPRSSLSRPECRRRP